jgi:di/tripeptidase
VIIKKMPIWSKAISIWPNIYWAHTVNEKCEIRSIGVLAEVLKKILINI